MDVDEFDQLTPHQQEAERRNLIARRSIAIGELNDTVRKLAYLGVETRLEVHEQNDTKKQVKVYRDPNVQGLPQTIPGPKYPSIMDVTSFPKKT